MFAYACAKSSSLFIKTLFRRPRTHAENHPHHRTHRIYFPRFALHAKGHLSKNHFFNVRVHMTKNLILGACLAILLTTPPTTWGREELNRFIYDALQSVGLELVSASKFAGDLSSFDDSQLSDSGLKFYFQRKPVTTRRLPAQSPQDPAGRRMESRHWGRSFLHCVV